MVVIYNNNSEVKVHLNYCKLLQLHYNNLHVESKKHGGLFSLYAKFNQELIICSFFLFFVQVGLVGE